MAGTGQHHPAGTGCQTTAFEADAFVRGDVLDATHTHGDLLLQITGSTSGAVHDAAEQTLPKLGQWRVHWRWSGQRPENRTQDGRRLSQNPFHFEEGHGNPATRI
ncbi:hypothetical protein AB0O01_00360 [Streptomyces sp. NPDC093252]|uniref:hypothetical protein n=1 Tax=Streptomyces sp. NPDC093252 TaxID=3154980 RepID=UPI003416491D